MLMSMTTVTWYHINAGNCVAILSKMGTIVPSRLINASTSTATARTRHIVASTWKGNQAALNHGQWKTSTWFAEMISVWVPHINRHPPWIACQSVRSRCIRNPWCFVGLPMLRESHDGGASTSQNVMRFDIFGLRGNYLRSLGGKAIISTNRRSQSHQQSHSLWLFYCRRVICSFILNLSRLSRLTQNATCWFL